MTDAALSRLKCSICLATYACPKTLPCLHTFCKPCIKNWVTSGVGAMELTANTGRCPICRKQFAIPPGGIETMPTNFDIVGIIEELQQSSLMASLSVVSSFCVDCSKKGVECYCENCSRLLCALCVLENHRDHASDRLDVAYNRHKHKIDESVGDVVSCCIEVNNALRRNEEVLAEIDRNANQSTESIKTTFDGIRSQLDRREQHLLSAVENIRKGKSAILLKQRLQFESMRSEINSVISEASKLLNEGKQEKLLERKDSMRETLMKQVDLVCESHLGSDCDAFLECQCSAVNVASVVRHVDSLGAVYCQVSPPHCTAEGRAVSEVLVDEESRFTVVLRDMFGNICCEEHAEIKVHIKPVKPDELVILATVLTGNPDGMYPIAYCLTNKNTIVINVLVNDYHIQGSPFEVKPSSHDFRKGIEFTQVTAANLYKAGGCVVGINGEVIVTDVEQHCVMVFNSELSLLRMFGSHGSGNHCFNNPSGIAVDSRNRLFIADSGNNRIVVSHTDRDSSKSFGIYGIKQGEFVLPGDVAIGYKNGQQVIYVADTYNHRVQVFNHVAIYHAVFGIQGESPGCFKYPRAITTDSQGLVFVCDSRVQVFSPENWQFIRIFDELLSSHLEKPLGITASEDDYVLIADASGIVVANQKGELMHASNEYKPVSIYCTRIMEKGTFVAMCDSKHLYLGRPM